MRGSDKALIRWVIGAFILCMAALGVWIAYLIIQEPVRAAIVIGVFLSVVVIPYAIGKLLVTGVDV